MLANKIGNTGIVLTELPIPLGAFLDAHKPSKAFAFFLIDHANHTS